VDVEREDGGLHPPYACCDFLQDVAGEAPTASAGQIVPDFAEIVLALGRKEVSRHLASGARRVELRYQLGHDGLAVNALALPQRFEALGDFGVHLVPAEPAPLRQIPLYRLADELPSRTVLLGGSGLCLGQQAGGIRASAGRPVFMSSSVASAVDESSKQ